MPKLLLATVATGTPKWPFVHSVFELINTLRGVFDISLEDVPESRPSHGRIKCVQAFLQSDADALLFVDCDQHIRWQDVVALWRSGHDVVGCAVPRKSPEPDAQGRHIFNVRFLPQGTVENVGGCFEVQYIGTGMLMVRRAAIVRMIAESGAPRCAVWDGGVDDPQNEGCYDFFPEPVINGEKLSEDYGFCHLWRGIGGKVYLYPSAWVDHYGDYRYSASIESYFERQDAVHNPAEKPLITVVHATARPEKWRAVYDAYVKRAVVADFEYVLVTPSDQGFYAPGGEIFELAELQGNYVGAANFGTAVSSGQIILLATDDMYPPLMWDAKVKALIPDPEKEVVLWVDTTHQSKDIITMQVLTRKRFDRYGYVFHPDFESMHGDDFFTHQAQRDAKAGLCDLVDGRGLLTFEHRHWTEGRRERDEVDAKNSSAERFARGKATLDRLLAEEKGEAA